MPNKEWKVYKWYDDNGKITRVGVGESSNCLVARSIRGADKKHMLDNARLVSAAPDLQHAVSLVLRDLYDQDILLQDDTEKALISAISKSKGVTKS